MGQIFHLLNAIQDSAQSKVGATMENSDMSSLCERCPGQRWVKLRTVLDSADSSWVLSQTALNLYWYKDI